MRYSPARDLGIQLQSGVYAAVAAVRLTFTAVVAAFTIPVSNSERFDCDDAEAVLVLAEEVEAGEVAVAVHVSVAVVEAAVAVSSVTAARVMGGQPETTPRQVSTQ